MLQNSSIFVAGHRGLVGSAICRRLQDAGYTNLVLRTRRELDLRNQAAVHEFFETVRPEYVFLAAARVGGILANSTYPAEFIYDNLTLQTNVIHSAWRCDAKKVLVLGSSCVYPRITQQPIREEQLLTSSLEETNQWYAIAKIAGLKLAQAYRIQYGFNAICAMPTNLYGPGDNFDLQNSHVIPAILRKFCEARDDQKSEVVLWGSGEPRREFLHVDDLADACIFLMQAYEGGDVINVGTGTDVAIRELAELVQRIIGFSGGIRFDRTKPDGTPRKLLDVSRIANLGWNAKIPLEQGLADTYRWYSSNRQLARV